MHVCFTIVSWSRNHLSRVLHLWIQRQERTEYPQGVSPQVKQLTMVSPVPKEFTKGCEGPWSYWMKGPEKLSGLLKNIWMVNRYPVPWGQCSDNFNNYPTHLFHASCPRSTGTSQAFFHVLSAYSMAGSSCKGHKARRDLLSLQKCSLAHPQKPLQWLLTYSIIRTT